MPKLEKVLHGDLDDISKKLNHGILSLCPLTNVRGTWETSVGNVRCMLIVYEKNDKKLWSKEEEKWKPQPHYALAVNLVDTGQEVRLCGITAGSSQEMYFIPDTGAEYSLFEALSITLDMWDRII